jgi:hypothetical protein
MLPLEGWVLNCCGEGDSEEAVPWEIILESKLKNKKK